MCLFSSDIAPKEQLQTQSIQAQEMEPKFTGSNTMSYATVDRTVAKPATRFRMQGLLEGAPGCRGKAQSHSSAGHMMDIQQNPGVHLLVGW